MKYCAGVWRFVETQDSQPQQHMILVPYS